MSFLVFSLNLILPNAPSLGHNPVPNLPGPKIPDLQLKILFVITLNGQDLRCRFQQPRCVQGPTTLTQTSKRVYRNYYNKDRSTPVNCSMMEFPRRGSTHDGTYCTLLYSHSWLHFPFRNSSSSFSLPFGPYFSCSCSCRKTRKHDSEHIPPIPAPAEA